MLQPIHLNPHDNVAVNRGERLAPSADQPTLAPAPLIAVRLPQRDVADRQARARVCVTAGAGIVAGLAGTFGLFRALNDLSTRLGELPIRESPTQPADDIVRASAVVLMIFFVFLAAPMVATAAVHRITNGMTPPPATSALGHALEGPDGERLPDAASFERWISRLGELPEVSNPRTRSLLEAAATEIVQAMHDHPELRPLCIAVTGHFGHIHGEPLVLAVDYLNDVIALERIFREGMDGAKIAKLWVSRLARDLVNEDVLASLSGEADEHLALLMAYQRDLNECLGLDVAGPLLVQGRRGNVPMHLLQHVAFRVRLKMLKAADVRNRILTWVALRERVERAFAEDICKVTSSFHHAMEILESDPNLREGDLIVALDEIMNRSLGAESRFIDDKILEIVDPHLDAALKPRPAV